MPDELEMPIGEDSDRITEEQLREIFEQRFKMFMNQLSEQCKDNNVQVALSILIDPKYPETPMVFRKGHIYDQAKLAVELARQLKNEIMNELKV